MISLPTRLRVACVLLGILCAAPVGAQQADDRTLSGLDILEMCGSAVLADQNYCKIIYEGVIWGAQIMAPSADGHRRICLPEDATSDTLKRVYETYMENHSREQDRTFKDTMADAYAEAFPCPTP
ncbi:hypothetical protein JCM17960_22390 [Magnetospira thiophila]